MSATTTSRSPPPSVESDEAHSGYDDCIRQDLTSRVFVDFEVFIKHVLHVPDDWRTLWGPAIDAVKVDSAFNKHHKEYREHCDGIGLQEYTFHGPVMDIMNTVIEVWSRSTSGNTTSKVSQYHRVNDPREPLDGVTNNVNPSRDLLVLHKDPKGEDEHWADLLHILQVRPDGGGLCDGKKIPRLVYNGKHSMGSSLDITDVGSRSRPDPEPCTSPQAFTTRRNEVYRVHDRSRVDFCVVQVQKATRRRIIILSRTSSKEEGQDGVHCR